VTQAMSPERSGGGHEHWLFHAAWGVVVALFWVVGSMSLRPADPAGAVSLLSSDAKLLMMVESVALAVLLGAIATVIAGRWYADIGAFAVGLGLGVVGLGGQNMTYLLMRNGSDRWFCLALLAEALAWCVVVAAAMVSSAMVARWFESDGGDSAGASVRSGMAAGGAPLLGRLFRSAPHEPDDWRQGVRHLVVVAVVVLVLIGVFASGRGDRAIRHGQACFAVAAAFYIGANRGQYYFPVRSTFWSCASVGVVCVSSYGVAWIRSGGSVLVGELASVPVSNYLRILPITLVSFGVSAVLLARWRETRRREVA